jgi:hypothetical protein
MSLKAEIRPLHLDDIPALAKFNSAFDGDTRTPQSWEARMSHWWLQNPAYDSSWIPGMILEFSGQIVGCIVSIPLRTIIQGTPMRAALRGTWRVKQSFRWQSLSVALALDTCYANLPSLNGTASADAYEVARVLGCQSLRDQLQITIAVSSWSQLFVKKASRITSAKAGLPSLIVDGSSADPDTFLDLAAASWDQYQNVVQFGPVRDAAYVSWYCLCSPSIRFSCFTLTCGPQSDNVFALTHHFGDGALHVVDLWPLSASPRQIRALLDSIISTAGRHGFHCVHIPHLAPPLKEAVTSIWPRRDVYEAQRSLYRVPDGMNFGDTQHWPVNFGDYGL